MKADQYIIQKKDHIFVSGALEIGEPFGAPNREYAIAERNRKAIGNFDNQRVVRFSDRSFLILSAISSTIKQLALKSCACLLDLEQIDDSLSVDGVILLDAGHHPYSDYYRRQTMRVVSSALSRELKTQAVTVLSSWKYIHTLPKPTWCMPDNDVSCERIFSGYDLLDLIKIRFS